MHEGEKRKRLLLQGKRLIGGEEVFASFLDVDQSTVNKWINDSEREISYNKAFLVEKYLGIRAALLCQKEVETNKYLKEHYALIKLVLQPVIKKEIIIPEPFPEFYLDSDRPIIIGNDGVLISGLEAFKVQLPSRTGHLRVAVLDLEALWEDRYSLEYIKLLPMEHLAVGFRIEQILKKAQNQNNDLKQPHPNIKKSNTKENFELCLRCDKIEGRKDEKIARVSGLKSKDAYHRLKKIRRQGIPALITALNKGQLSISAAASIAKLSEGKQKAELQSKRASISKQHH